MNPNRRPHQRQPQPRIRSHLTVPRVTPTLDVDLDENLGDEANCDQLCISWDIPDPRWQEFMAERYTSEMDSWDTTSHPEKIDPISLNQRKET